MSTFHNIRWRSNTASIIGLTVVGALAGSYFLSTAMDRKGNRMTSSSYIADNIAPKKKANATVPDHVLQAEVTTMLSEAEQRSKSFEMQRIERPTNNGPKRVDMMREE